MHSSNGIMNIQREGESSAFVQMNETVSTHATCNNVPCCCVYFHSAIFMFSFIHRMLLQLFFVLANFHIIFASFSFSSVLAHAYTNTYPSALHAMWTLLFFVLVVYCSIFLFVRFHWKTTYHLDRKRSTQKSTSIRIENAHCFGLSPYAFHFSIRTKHKYISLGTYRKRVNNVCSYNSKRRQREKKQQHVLYIVRKSVYMKYALSLSLSLAIP